MARDTDDSGQGSKISPLWFFYLQVMSVASALQLANIVDDFVKWKGLIKQFLADWKELFRPLIDFMFGWVKILFHVDLTEFAKDYLGVGLIVCASFLRYLVYYFSYPERIRRSKFADEEKYIGTFWNVLLSFTLLFVWTIFAWPVIIIFLVLAFFGTEFLSYVVRANAYIASRFVGGTRRHEYEERLGQLSQDNDTAFRNTARLIFQLSLSSFLYLFFLMILNHALFA